MNRHCLFKGHHWHEVQKLPPLILSEFCTQTPTNWNLVRERCCFCPKERTGYHWMSGWDVGFTTVQVPAPAERGQ